MDDSDWALERCELHYRSLEEAWAAPRPIRAGFVRTDLAIDVAEDGTVILTMTDREVVREYCG